MKIIITNKNVKSSENLNQIIESKFEKLDKYFSHEVEANITVAAEKDWQKVEATIQTEGTIFRAEEKADVAYDTVEALVEKLARQISRFKDKLRKKHRSQKQLVFDAIPDFEEEEIFEIVKRKKVELRPMNEEEAVMQMELLGHNFFVFLNMDTDSVCVLYTRRNGDYGIIEAV